ncbi:hypothetical protein C8J56DRAFT_941311 [Mycena floridula]|nr:hypothetical protein C8J56DRAFT_941311 [Mycena floridula]
MLPAPQDISPTNHLTEGIYGPMLVGVFLSTLLYGMFTYHEKSSKRDSIWTRGLVLCLFLCITLKTSFNMVAIYQCLVQQFDTDLGQLHPQIPFCNKLMPDNGIISTAVQLLMAWRIMVVTETRLWTCIIVAVSMLSFGASIWMTIEVSSKPAFSQFTEFPIDFSQFEKLRAAGMTWLISSAVADLMITGVLVYSLHVRKSGYNTSLDTYVNHIIRLTVQTGALTSIFALSTALGFNVVLKVFPFAWSLALPNLYISTILSSLNARDSWTNRGNALLPASSDDAYSQSGSNFWGSMALQNPPGIDIGMRSELNREMGVQRNAFVKEEGLVGTKLHLSHK